jgi:hypothetical protein
MNKVKKHCNDPKPYPELKPRYTKNPENSFPSSQNAQRTPDAHIPPRNGNYIENPED